jgi:hypothetical protein
VVRPERAARGEREGVAQKDVSSRPDPLARLQVPPRVVLCRHQERRQRDRQEGEEGQQPIERERWTNTPRIGATMVPTAEGGRRAEALRHSMHSSERRITES